MNDKKLEATRCLGRGQDSHHGTARRSIWNELARCAGDLQLDAAVVASARHRIDYTWHVDADASLKTLEWSKQSGYLKEIPTAAKLVDLSYLPAG